MGLFISTLWERMVGAKEMRILMVGLDAAGKVCMWIDRQIDRQIDLDRLDRQTDR